MMRAMLIKILNEKSKTYDRIMKLVEFYLDKAKKEEEKAKEENKYALANMYFAVRTVLEEIKLELTRMYLKEVDELEEDIIE